MKKREKLFGNFNASSKENWEQKARLELRDSSFEQLAADFIKDISIAPFYTKEDLAGLGYLESFRCANSSEWKYTELINITTEQQANEEALLALSGGADGIIFNSQNKKGDLNFRKLLKDIYSDACMITLKAGYENKEQGLMYIKHQLDQGHPLSSLSGGYNFDPINQWTLTGIMEENHFDPIHAFVKLAYENPHLKCVTIEGSHFYNSGASPEQEIALILSVAVEYLDYFTEAGFPPGAIFDRMVCSIAIGNTYFLEIAKVRSLRMLLNFLASSYKVDGSAKETIIYASTALWTKSLRDVHTNMIRNTTEAMAAIIGGCNHLTVSSFDLNDNAFSKRMARNISHLLKEESYFDKVKDIGAGSYYIENLTHILSEKAWELFQYIESRGGFINAFKKGEIQQMISQSRIRKLKDIEDGKTVFVGTNKYHNPGERISTNAPVKHTDSVQLEVELLRPQRATEAF